MTPVDHLNAALAKFTDKNAGYGKTDNPLANFYNAPPVTHRVLTPFVYAATLCAKQDDAVWSYISDPTPCKAAELCERLLDGLVYRAIMLALIDEEAAAKAGVDETATTR